MPKCLCQTACSGEGCPVHPCTCGRLAAETRAVRALDPECPVHGDPEDDVDTAIWAAEHEIEADEHMYDRPESFASKMGHPGGHYG